MYHFYMVVISCLGAKWYAQECKHTGATYSVAFYGSAQALRML